MSDFTFKVTADAAAAFGAVRGVEGELKGLTREAKRAGQEMSQSFSNAGSVIRQAMAIGGIGLGARELIDMADSVTNLRNRLRGVSSSTEEANAKFDRLRQIASNTRADLSSTGEAFVRITRATASLGLSQERVFAMTETLGKAMAQSGASGSEMTAGMLQLAQAMSSGRLQGDELRSVLENIPIVAEAIEKSLGVNRAGLRKLAEEGKITTAVIVEAFEKAKNDIDRGFGNTIPTIGQQMQALKNDLAVGAGTALASVTPHINAATKALEQNVRKQREAIESGVLSTEKLMESARGMMAVADAVAAAIDRARVAIEAFGEAGDVAAYRARKAIEDFVNAGSVDKLTEQWDRARQRAVDAAMAIAVDQGLGHDMGKVLEHNLKIAEEGGAALARETERAAKAAQKLREEYDKIGKALLGPGITPESHRVGMTVEEEREIEAANLAYEVKKLEDAEKAEIDSAERLHRVRQEMAETQLRENEEFQDQIKRAQQESAEARIRMEEEFQRTMMTGLGSISAQFVSMAAQGEISMGKLGEALAKLALQMAAMQIGGPWGAFLGSFAGGLNLGGNRYGGDHMITGRPLETFGLPRAQYGADWRVGGPPGPDKTLVAFWGSRDESVHVRTPADRHMAANMNTSTAGPVSVTVVAANNERDMVAAGRSYEARKVYAENKRRVNDRTR
jgi:tape measure domain-containing protein